MAKTRPGNGSTSKRVRRSPEVLLKELNEKMQKLEARVFKKNKETVHHIGVHILKKADFDFTELTEKDEEEIAKMTERGVNIANKIIEKAYANIQHR